MIDGWDNGMMTYFGKEDGVLWLRGRDRARSLEGKKSKDGVEEVEMHPRICVMMIRTSYPVDFFVGTKGKINRRRGETASKALESRGS